MKLKTKIQRALMRELNTYMQEASLLRADLIRFKNKYRNNKPLDTWVVIK